ncbi:MAG TPA: hypothetical protein VG125_10320 [Pirellulales bacterium]|jgi:hypothetical protein|nr:hypothetical protein [Pirellulales bacterium]
MASSENQGLQIALIIFVMLTILLSVTTFMFFREYEEAVTKSKTDAENATKQQQAARDALAESETLRKFIGVSDAAKLEDVRATFEEDMKKFANTAPDESKFYRTALEHAHTSNESKTAEVIAARDTIQQEKDAREKVEKAKQEQVAAAEENARKAETDLAAAKKSFEEDRKRMNDDMADLARQLKDKNDAYTELADTSKKQLDEVTADKNKLARFNDVLEVKNQQLDPTSGFEVPDGKIVWVDQRSRTAYINVGSADGLRRQTLFSVVAGDEQVGRDQKTKGRLEVTEILDAHFAECRITDDKIIDPIVQGDKIFTPLWQPGRAEGFAIIGFIDIDGDGVDDRPMVRDLIRMNGGRIDAEDTQDGKQVGELNLNTRYVILGQPPDESEVAKKAYTKLQRDARAMGVRDLSVNKFLDQVGWKDQNRTINFGRRGNANQVPPEQRDGGPQQAPGAAVAGAYKFRRPPGSRGLKGMNSQGTAPKQPAGK